MPDVDRIDQLLRAANPVPDEGEVMQVVTSTDPLWQTIRSRLAEDAPMHPDDLRTHPHVREDRTMTRTDTPPARDESMRDRSRALVAAGVALALIVGSALAVQRTRSAPVQPVEVVPTEDAARAVGPDEASFAFTFTGEPGDAGCTYDGPRLAEAGLYESSLTNSAAGAGDAMVTLVELEPGYDYDDFIERLTVHGEGYPARMKAEDHDPRNHAWMADAEWWEVHRAAPGKTHRLRTRLTLQPGRYVMFCWREAEVRGESDVWPVGPLTVPG